MSNGGSPTSGSEAGADFGAGESSTGGSATITSVAGDSRAARCGRFACLEWRLDMSGAQQLVDAADQRAFVRRLDDVVLGALAKAPCAIGLHRLGADDQHRDRAGGGVAR